MHEGGRESGGHLSESVSNNNMRFTVSARACLRLMSCLNLCSMCATSENDNLPDPDLHTIFAFNFQPPGYQYRLRLRLISIVDLFTLQRIAKSPSSMFIEGQSPLCKVNRLANLNTKLWLN